MKDENIKRLVEELNSVSCRLADLNHYLNEITTYGFLSPELTKAIMTIAKEMKKDEKN